MARRKRAPKKTVTGDASKRRRRRTGAAQLAFEAIAIEGGLLSPDWLARAAQLEAGGQEPADYRIPRGLNLRDEIGRYWRIAQALWNDFCSGSNASDADEAKAVSVSERFVVPLLFDCFGFGSLVRVDSIELADRTYGLMHSALDGLVPVVIAPARFGLDSLSPRFGDGMRRRSAFGLAQEFLNAKENALWGIATDGVTLRILRDNASLTRPAWIQADLARIFSEERYADFAALWLLMHETRFGRSGQPATECSLETWRVAGREQGTRAREQLRHGVQEALLALGQGFLAHAGNHALREALSNGELTKETYFHELLRLAYRLIFLLTVEERGVLHPDSSGEAACRLYVEGYGLRGLRERAVKRSAHDRHHDHWERVKIVFRGLATGEERLALPALAGLFAANQCPTLDNLRLENRFLLLAIFRLSWLREEAGLARVNWRDMGPEELGSVYESLLELIPEIAEGGRLFSFRSHEDAAAGHARKTTGSYYTPDSLVQLLLDSALEPVVERTIAENPQKPVEALLSLAIVDPACGSGHFLLAAARRLGAHVARLQASGTPSAAEYRHALRLVVSRCIYGVDLNPMAVELCKVSLWMEALEPGLPLTFLNSHIRHGNALIGTSPELMAEGIPDDAWKPIEGDDKAVASALRKRNKAAADGQRGLDTLWSTPQAGEAAKLTEAITALDSAPDADVAELEEKEARWQDLLSSKIYQHQKLVADTWCAAHLWPKRPGPIAEAAPTNDLWRQIRDGKGVPPRLTVETVMGLADQYTFFHWHLAFPQITKRGGFDIVLGNPPWDTLSPDSKEFFSVYEPEIRFQSKKEQAQTIKRLLEDPAIDAAWTRNRRGIFGSAHYMKKSGRFSLFAPGNLGKGDFNLYRIFIELALLLVREKGWAAQIAPDGLYAGANSMAIRKELFENFELTDLFGFENAKETWFPGVDSRAKFSLYAAQRGGPTETFRAAFSLRTPSDLKEAVSGPRALRIPVELVQEFSPQALAIMEFRGQRDIDIAQKMYACFPPLGHHVAGTAHRSYLRELESGHVQKLLTEDERGLPHYEGRMIGQYDYRAKGYRSGRARAAVWEELPFGSPAKTIQPQWYVHADAAPEKTKLRIGTYRVAFCDVASPTNERTLVAAMLPQYCIAGAKVPTIQMQSDAPEADLLVWLAVANSFCMDFLVRMKVGLTMALSILDSLPFPRLPLEGQAARWLIHHALVLSCTGPEMDSLWDEMGAAGFIEPRHDRGHPGATDPSARLQSISRIEAVVAHLYGLSRAEVDYILTTFPIVKRNDERVYGEYRTKRAILEAYDDMTGGADRSAKLQSVRPTADARGVSGNG